MAFVTFVGDPRLDGHGPRVVRLFETDFPKSEAVEYDGPGLAKLRANDHFVVADEEPAPERKKPGRKPKAETAPESDPPAE